MNNQYIVAITLFLLVPLYIFLCARVILQRREHKVAYTHHIDDVTFQATVSAQRNFNDYTPLALILIMYLYQLEVNTLLLLILCGFLVAGRYCHASGILYFEQRHKPSFRFRKLGMQCTFFSMIASSITAVIYAFMY